MNAILDLVELPPFRIERFYAQYEHTTRFMLSSSDCESRTIAELLELEHHPAKRLPPACDTTSGRFGLLEASLVS